MFYALIVLAAASRLLPHPINFAPIGALGLFAGAYLNRRGTWAVPLLALLVSDAVLGFYHPMLMAFVYGGFAVGGLLGRRFLHERRTPVRLGLCALAGSAAFFLLSNFGVWVCGGCLGAGLYPRTWSGLVTCYTMALPFFRNTVLGDLFYTAALFGGYEAVQQWAARRRALQALCPHKETAP
jgi:hypothetical protein